MNYGTRIFGKNAYLLLLKKKKEVRHREKKVSPCALACLAVFVDR